LEKPGGFKLSTCGFTDIFSSKLVDLHNLETKLHDESWGLANKNGDMMDHDGLWDVMALMSLIFSFGGLYIASYSIKNSIQRMVFSRFSRSTRW
jgi:hypothetical protein